MVSISGESNRLADENGFPKADSPNESDNISNDGERKKLHKYEKKKPRLPEISANTHAGVSEPDGANR